jgi:gas vesicle protein
MFFKKYYQQKQRKLIATTLFTGIASGVTGFFVSHFFNPKNGLENREKLSKEANKALKYANKTKEELLVKAKTVGQNISKNIEQKKNEVKENIEDENN